LEKIDEILVVIFASKIDYVKEGKVDQEDFERYTQSFTIQQFFKPDWYIG